MSELSRRDNFSLPRGAGGVDVSRMSVSRFAKVAAVALLAAFSGAAASAVPVWVVGNGFHSSLGVRVRDVPAWRALPVARGAERLLIGWGDAQWYQGNENIGTFFSAVFWPTPSILLLVPVREPFAKKYPHSDVIRLELTDAQFAKLRARLESAFARDASGRPIYAGKGFAPRSAYYLGSGSFYFPKMCNYWVAEQLQKSGIPLSRFRSISAAGLVHETAPHGTVESRRGGKKDYF